jgi:TonB-linked SusC/RagA family outer membrane protein
MQFNADCFFHFYTFTEKREYHAAKLKRLLVMKFTILLLTVFCLKVNAGANAQQITLSLKNVSIEDVLREIQKQSGYNFVYNATLISNKQKVTISVKDASLDEALKQCFKDQPIVFEIAEKTIVLKPRPVERSVVNEPVIAAEDIVLQTPVRGTIRDSTGRPVAGATVQVKGKPGGTATNANGSFSIEANAGDVLVISSVSYITQEVRIKDVSAVINVTLQMQSREIEQMVVTALGIKRQTKVLSYEVQKVGRDDLTEVQNANFTNNLVGRVAGVNISPSASGIGGSTRVVMRGAKSISQGASSNALYVIDGVPLLNSSFGGTSVGVYGGISGSEGIADFNPEDIESVNILTGPAGAALYGADAANGVVIITTRKGMKDGFKLNYSNSSTFLKPFVKPELQNRYGNRVGEYESWGNKLAVPSDYDPFSFFNTGVQQINSLNASIGNAKEQTFLSFSSTNGSGIIPNNKYNRYNFTFRNTASFLDDKITTDFSASYVKQTDQNMASQGQYYNPLPALYLFPRNDEGNEIIKYYERYSPANNYYVQNWPYNDQGLQLQNPGWIVNRMLFQTNRDRYMFSGNITYNIAKGISVIARARIDNTAGKITQKFYASTAGNFAKPNGFYSSADQNLSNIYTDLIGTFNRNYGDISVNVNAGGSYQTQKTVTEGLGGNLSSVANLFSRLNIIQAELLPTAQPYFNKVSASAFASAEIGYKSFLFLTATGRNDWISTQVNTKEPSFFYPSVGLSAILTDILKLPRTISYLKVRGNYSSVGLPLTLIGLTPGTETNPLVPGNFPSTTGKYPFPDFKVQRTKTTEVGVNLKLFRNRLGLDVTLYQSNTYNQLFLATLPPATGYNGFYIQAGNISNKGIEAAVSYAFKAGNIGYNTAFTFTLNRNRIVQMVRNYPNPIDGTLYSTSAVTIDGTRLKEGDQVGDLYTSAFLQTDENGNIYIDSSGNFPQAPQLANPLRLGSTNPNYTMGWRNDLTYKNFGIGFVLFGRVGGIVLSQTQGILDMYGVSKASADARDRGGVMVNGVLNPNIENYYKATGLLDAYHIYSATNVRLQEAYISYQLPKKILNDKIGLNLSVIGTNLLMIYNKAPFDPQLTGSTSTFYQGIDYFMLPSLRSFGFSIKAQF